MHSDFFWKVIEGYGEGSAAPGLVLGAEGWRQRLWDGVCWWSRSLRKQGVWLWRAGSKWSFWRSREPDWVNRWAAELWIHLGLWVMCHMRLMGRGELWFLGWKGQFWWFCWCDVQRSLKKLACVQEGKNKAMRMKVEVTSWWEDERKETRGRYRPDCTEKHTEYSVVCGKRQLICSEVCGRANQSVSLNIWHDFPFPLTLKSCCEIQPRFCLW